ncbi:calcium-binding protein [Amaricoccus sp.]|uniref:beta strand repeat-containing protein n=1 Tax=Amaricoccus sp. TaxID=1872485 RepID=UPI001B6BE1DB|nr:calcium-binding protein [Amaricoccus sp.]MBP7001420.1 hypothetical protein [Amaricoccus sp.]
MAVINGDDNPNTLNGGAENDTLNGFGGDDTLDGRTGIDTLNGGEGNDRLIIREDDSGFGGAGDDVLEVSDDEPLVLSGGAGYDILHITGGWNITGATLSGIEQLNLRGRVFPSAEMTTAQLAQFSLVSGSTATDDDAELTLTTGGAASVNLSATLSEGFQLNGSEQDDRITFNAGYLGKIWFFGDEGNDVVNAGAGADELDGEDGNDTLNGLGGSDILDGGDGIDTLNGGAGDDLLIAREGDTANGGAGDDMLEVSDDAPLMLNGGAGYDILHITGSYDVTGSTIVGVEQLNLRGRVFPVAEMTTAQLAQFAVVSGVEATDDDAELDLTAGGTASVTLSATLTEGFQLNGSVQNDVITFNAGYLGKIWFFGGNGDDTVNAAAGADELNGDAGNDTLNAFGGNDVLLGGLGADVLRGGAGDDFLAGRSGTAIDQNDSAADQLFGEAGNDTLLVNVGDTADGGAGNDVIVSVGASTLIGGDGNDRIVASNGNDTISGGAGTDELSYERTAQVVNVDLAITAPQATGGGGTDTISGFENLTGGTNSDTLRGTTGANVIRGLAGNDIIDGRGGSDTASYVGAGAVTVDLRIAGQQNTLGAGLDTLTSIENLIGSSNNDTLTGTAGANVIEGGTGTDILNGLGGVDTASYASAGNLVVVNLSVAVAQNTVGAGVDTLSGFENLLGSAFGDTLTGTAGANLLQGGLGNDTLRGLDGVDDLRGNDGNDTLDGGLGADVMTGGNGNDTYVLSEAGDVMVESLATSGGNDLVQAPFDFTLADGFERLTLTGVVALVGNGNAANNTIGGNGLGNTLRGLAGNDTLNGGGGNDVLIGGAGVDTLNGGASNDTFVFQSVGDSAFGTPDVIVAFDGAGGSPGDRIDVSGIDANGSGAGNGAFTFGSTAAGGLWTVDVGQDTFVYANLDADVDPEFAIRITDGATGAGSYTLADFVL